MKNKTAEKSSVSWAADSQCERILVDYNAQLDGKLELVMWSENENEKKKRKKKKHNINVQNEQNIGSVLQLNEFQWNANASFANTNNTNWQNIVRHKICYRNKWPMNNERCMFYCTCFILTKRWFSNDFVRWHHHFGVSKLKLHLKWFVVAHSTMFRIYRQRINCIFYFVIASFGWTKWNCVSDCQWRRTTVYQANFQSLRLQWVTWTEIQSKLIFVANFIGKYVWC